MEIGIITSTNVFPPNFGGAVRIFQIAKNLGELECQVHLFIPRAKGSFELKNVYVHPSRELSDLKEPINIPGMLALSKSLTRFMKRLKDYEGMDIIQSEGPWNAPHCLILKSLFRTPAVLDEHNVETMLWYRISKVKKRRWKRIRVLESLACKIFDHVLAVSSFDKSAIQELFFVDPSKVTVIANGVDTQHFSPKRDEREKIRLKYGLSDEPVVLFIGRLSWFPNVDALNIIFSDIYPVLKKSIPEAVFMVVGANPPFWLKSKDKDLIVTGSVNDVVPYINAADVCIAPLRFGSGTRLKILEFMACEKPVVSTSLGVEGLDVVSGEHLIIEDQVAKFADCIIRLIENKEFATRLGKNARVLTQQYYDWKRITQKLLSTYKMLLSLT